MVPSISTSNIDYIKKLVTRQILAIQKANPDADIIFIGPADMERQSDGRWKTYPALRMTIAALREVALENGVAYWDMHRVMGGNGTMSKWVKREPPLGFTDHIHFTRRGATHMGDLFSSSLRMYYDFFKFRGRHNISDKKLLALRSFNDSISTAEAKKPVVEETTKKPIAAPAPKPITEPVRKPVVAEQPDASRLPNSPCASPSRSSRYANPSRSSRYANPRQNNLFASRLPNNPCASQSQSNRLTNPRLNNRPKRQRSERSARSATTRR